MSYALADRPGHDRTDPPLRTAPVGPGPGASDPGERDEIADRYRQLVELSPDGILLIVDGRIAFMNPEGLRLLGAPGSEDVLGRKALDFVHPDSRDAVAASLARLEAEGGQIVHRERSLLRVDGTALEVETAGSSVSVAGEPAIQVVFRDITEQKMQVRALREREETFRALVENTDDIVARLDAEGRCVYVNPAVTRHLGVAPGDLTGMAFKDIGMTPGAARLVERAVRTVFRTDVPCQEEIELKTLCGLRVFHWRLIPEHDDSGNPRTALSTLHDVTEARQAQDDLVRSLADLRRLSGRLDRVREDERAAVAREIHDQLGQALTGLKLDTVWLERRIGAGLEEAGPESLLTRLGRMRRLLDETMRSVRRIATDLRPPMLDDLGLVAAVQWEAERFTQRSGIPVKVTSKDRVPTGQASALALFRILQESLTNVARHAQATAVTVELRNSGRNVVLAVRDDGRGFDPSAVPGGSLGLVGMRERTEQAGGTLSIVSRAGSGTTIRASIPA